MQTEPTENLVSEHERLKSALAYCIDRNRPINESEEIMATIKAIVQELRHRTANQCCACGVFLDQTSRKVSVITKADCDIQYGLCRPCYEQAQAEMRESIRLKALTEIDN